MIECYTSVRLEIVDIGEKKVLMMAAITYVAAAVQSLAVFVFFVVVLVSQGRKRKVRDDRDGSATSR